MNSIMINETMRRALSSRFFRAARCVSILLAIQPVLHSAEPLQVKTVPAARGDIHRWISIPGTLKANQQATLYAKVAGYLSNVAVDKGDTVKAGQVLGEIEVPELLADAKKFEADVKVAEVELSRLVDAQKKAPDLILPQALDKARGTAEMARATIERTRTLLDFAKITAPFPGIITQRFVDTGAFVPSATGGSAAQNAAIFTLMDYTTVRAQFAVPEMEALGVRNSLPVKVALDAIPGKPFTGTVTRFAGALDESTRTMIVEADLPNPEGILRPGMYANVKLAIEKHTGTVLVPVEALLVEKTSASIFKIMDGKARKTAVKVGFNDGTSAEILEGLSDGEMVIVFGKTAISDGQPVKAEAAK